MHTTLQQAHDAVEHALMNGFDLPELANMIRDITTIEDYVADMHDDGADDSENWLLAHIKDELHSAWEYMEMWKQTNRPEYHEMAIDELRHAHNLIQIAEEQGFSRYTLRSVVAKYNELSEELSK